MKKLGILFLSVLSLGLTVTSCNDDDSNEAAKASIVGKWDFDTMEGTYGSETFAAGTKENLWSDASCDTPSYWQFEEGTALQYGQYASSNDCQLSVLNVSYSVNADRTSLTVNTPAGAFNYPIVKLTSTEFSWREQGTAQGVTYNVVHNMKKK